MKMYKADVVNDKLYIQVIEVKETPTMYKRITKPLWNSSLPDLFDLGANFRKKSWGDKTIIYCWNSEEAVIELRTFLQDKRGILNEKLKEIDVKLKILSKD